jgi:hypothetical protein
MNRTDNPQSESISSGVACIFQTPARSAGFRTCRIAGFQTCGHRRYFDAPPSWNSAIQQVLKPKLPPLLPRHRGGCELFGLALFLALTLSGCVTKSQAEAQARAAFAAGEQQAMERMRQSQAQGPNVTFLGPVRNTLVPWTAQLTLAKAIVAANYFGPKDPAEIIIRRGGEEIRLDPKKLLGGEDVPLLPRDIVELKP